jgi:hypothetical protein
MIADMQHLDGAITGGYVLREALLRREAVEAAAGGSATAT